MGSSEEEMLWVPGWSLEEVTKGVLEHSDQDRSHVSERRAVLTVERDKDVSGRGWYKVKGK